MSGSDDSGNMDVTAESIIALVGIVLALPPCIVLVWKWRIIRRALRSGEQTVAAEAPQEAARHLDMDDVAPILPLHHNRRAMTGSSTNTNASAITDNSSAPSTKSKASSTFSTTTTNASSTTDVSVSSEKPSAVSSKASSITTIEESPEESSTDETSTETTKRTHSFVTNLIGMTKNLLQEGDNLISSPQRIELVVVEGKVQSIHLLCRTKLSPLFRIPGYPYSLESPV